MNEAILIFNEEYFFSYLRLEQKKKKMMILVVGV